MEVQSAPYIGGGQEKVLHSLGQTVEKPRVPPGKTAGTGKTATVQALHCYHTGLSGLPVGAFTGV